MTYNNAHISNKYEEHTQYCMHWCSETFMDLSTAEQLQIHIDVLVQERCNSSALVHWYDE